jgi:2-aminoadipate transaminase
MNGASRERASGAELLAREAAHRTSPSATDLQYGHTDGVIDLTWGHPDPSALATDAIAQAAEVLLSTRGWQALSYGAPAGAMSLRASIAEHLGHVDGVVAPDDIVIAAGSSGALELVLSLCAVPGDVVFVEQPTYFLALRMFVDHGLRIVGLHSTEEGPDPEHLDQLAAEAARAGVGSLLYLVPTYANPTGRCLGAERARALLDVAARRGVTVIEDDVYRDTNPVAPPSMFSLDPTQVVRLGSFSKSLAPGLRVGYLTSTPAVVNRIATCGLLDSGGGSNHFAAMVVGEVMRSGRFAEVVSAGQDRYRARRTALSQALDHDLFRFDEPDGGFFVWLRLPDGCRSSDVVDAARAGGVLVSDGRLFFADRADDSYVRVSFSMLEHDLLVEGATRLNLAVSRMKRR